VPDERREPPKAPAAFQPVNRCVADR
jgi:hypothetical protein